ncbi:MAG TPA: membrane protein insertion efficiency factor YidD [Acidimicrobiales bacterium]|nr:membrane protein insertion efficiency factor YidD [Acidimicrobiales bacterium]
MRPAPVTARPEHRDERRPGDLVCVAERRDPPRRPVSGWLIAAIHIYQLARSGRPTGCRFLPTCSEYAIEAIDRHGSLRGARLAAGRLLRCHPWGRHGVDPVPDRRTPCSR